MRTNKKTASLILFTIIIISLPVIWWRAPQRYGPWDKQTLFVWLADIIHGQSVDKEAHALWMDDDSGEGVFAVKAISDQVGIRPAYAVIAERMTAQVADSLAAWQRQGKATIALHGLRHERWKEWNEEAIEQYIRQTGITGLHLLFCLCPVFFLFILVVDEFYTGTLFHALEKLIAAPCARSTLRITARHYIIRQRHARQYQNDQQTKHTLQQGNTP